MKTFVLDRIEKTLEELPIEKLIESLVHPNGLLVVMSAYNDVLEEFHKRVRSALGEQAPKPAWVRESRPSAAAAREMLKSVYAMVCDGNGSGSVLALCDQPWPVVEDAFEESANEYREVLRHIQRGNGQITFAYVMLDTISHEKARERYNLWAGDYKNLPRLPGQHRVAFFSLREFEDAPRQAWKGEWKHRLGECREKFCTAVLRMLAAVVNDLGANHPRAWRLLVLSIMADFEKKDDPRTLARIVDDELQPGTRGWGHDTAVRPNADERVGLIRLNATTECLEWLAKKRATPDLMPALANLTPSSGAFAVLAGWSRLENKSLNFHERINAVEQLVREARNRIEHDESMPTPLYFSAVEQLTVSLEEFAWQAWSSAPPARNRWRLGDEAWKQRLIQMTGAQVNERAKQGRDFLVRTHRLSNLQELLAAKRLTVQELSPTLTGATALLAILPALDVDSARDLARVTEWEEWRELAGTEIDLRRELAAKVV